MICKGCNQLYCSSVFRCLRKQQHEHLQRAVSLAKTIMGLYGDFHIPIWLVKNFQAVQDQLLSASVVDYMDLPSSIDVLTLKNG